MILNLQSAVYNIVTIFEHLGGFIENVLSIDSWLYSEMSSQGSPGGSEGPYVQWVGLLHSTYLLKISLHILVVNMRGSAWNRTKPYIIMNYWIT